MNEVSCRVFDIFERPLAAKRVPAEIMVAGTSLSLAQLRNKKERITWRDFLIVMRNLRAHFTDEEYLELGRSYIRSPPLRFAFVIGRLLLSPIELYRWMNKPREGAGNQLFTCVTPKQRELSENELEIELTMSDGYEVCWDFYLVTIGHMEELPTLLGLPRSTVTLTRLPNGGRYHVVIPRGTPLLARLWRLLTWPFTVRTAARELKEAHETLIERYLEIEDARAKLDRQATQLRTAHSVNDLVQRDLDLVRTLDTVAKALVDEAGFMWAEIALRVTDPSDGASARIARCGAAEHEPPLERVLEARGGEVIGDLRVAPKPGANREEREELLAFIVPTLAVA